jgi:hypothetical protein
MGWYCAKGEHDKCPGSKVTPGEIGGWMCACDCHLKSKAALTDGFLEEALSIIDKMKSQGDK